MFYIDIFEKNFTYSGIQRESIVLLKCKAKIIKKYLDLFENERILYSRSNLNTLIEISNLINEQEGCLFSEVIMYGDSFLSDKNYSVHIELLGFDISGDSFYISPLKNMSMSMKRTIIDSSMLNDDGLFKSVDLAEKMIKFLYSQKDPNFYELDGKLRVVYVYRVSNAKTRKIGDDSVP